ncbi:protein tyrosine phosphatase domain-containing protein 1 isoform X1 [Bufo gargarizans]|uniref:protein tyrosine phosphatase domain-containing protein 1 isoform X1 n=1 Tax=Bufo gargarizans TaxID=30331 RepID=UPI001CF0E160|nr:protein tyrosine phosphatase domain-containing protein 1 isoform X1 [Bufo gargarizans]
MVKVMSFALQEGKVAIHCHAGLGRTGVLIACYLIYATRMTADQAILFVRAKRHNAIQTRVQLLCVREFTQFLIPLHNVFSCCDPKAHAVTLSQYLIRQQHLLHGYEARHLKYVPKIIHLICKVLIDLVENRLVVEEQILDVPDLSAEIEKTVSQLSTEQLDKVLGCDIGTVDSLTHSVTTAVCYGVQDSVLSSEQEFDPLWKRRNVECLQPLSHLKKRLSYSDSDLNKAEILLEQGETPWTEPSHLTFLSKLNEQLRSIVSGNEDAHPLPTPNLKKDASTAFSFWSQSKVSSIDVPRDCSPLFYRPRFLREIQRSRTFSLGFSSPLNGQTGLTDSQFSAPSITPQDTPDCSCVTGISKVLDDESSLVDDNSEVSSPKVTFYLGCNETPEVIPQIVLQSELNLEARRLLTANALANLECDSVEEISRKVTMWQKELNAREAAWDRICAERNPFVLTNLMWSWLEQLKEPVITKAGVHLLASYGSHPDSALYLLEKGQHQTILCILQCVSNLRPLPSEIEDAILTRMIAAFTMIEPHSEDSSLVYNTLKPIFLHALTDIRK